MYPPINNSKYIFQVGLGLGNDHSNNFSIKNSQISGRKNGKISPIIYDYSIIIFNIPFYLNA